MAGPLEAAEVLPRIHDSPLCKHDLLKSYAIPLPTRGGGQVGARRSGSAMATTEASRAKSYAGAATSHRPRARYVTLTLMVTRRLHMRKPSSVMRCSTSAAVEVPANAGPMATT